MQHGLLLVQELGQDEGAALGAQGAVEVVEVVPLDARAPASPALPRPQDVVILGSNSVDIPPPTLPKSCLEF